MREPDRRSAGSSGSEPAPGARRGRLPCTVCVTLWTTRFIQVFETARGAVPCVKSRESATRHRPERQALPQVRGGFQRRGLAGGYPQLIHTRLWITRWMYPSMSVDRPVDDSVHNPIPARQHMQS